jgi:hypothetical protein
MRGRYCFTKEWLAKTGGFAKDGRGSAGEFAQALDHEGDAHGHQGSHDDPLPEMDEQKDGGEHGEDQCEAPDRLDKCATQERFGHDEQDQDNPQTGPDVVGG